MKSIILVALLAVAATCAAENMFQELLQVKKENDNKKVINDYFQDVFVKKDAQTVRKYFAENVISHDPSTANGLEPVVKAYVDFLSSDPTSKLNRLAADGDIVFMYIESASPGITSSIPGNPKAISTVDIYRLKDRKIVEYWAVFQPVF